MSARRRPGARRRSERHLARGVRRRWTRHAGPGLSGRPARAAAGPDPGARLRADRAALPGAVRRPAGQPPPRPGRAVAARPGAGFYTIGSSGHEGNAGVAAALRLTDPALLHYRSGAFYLARAPAGQPAPGRCPGRAARAGRRGGRADRRRAAQGVRPRRPAHHPADLDHRLAPAARGRAWPSRWAGPPGWAPPPWPADAIVVASLGDASVNHSTAAGAINTAGVLRLPAPAAAAAAGGARTTGSASACGPRPAGSGPPPGPCRAVGYFHADGSDLAAVYDTALAAAAWVRERRSPAFLHLAHGALRRARRARTWRPATAARPTIAADLAADPLLGTARLLVTAGLLTPAEVLHRYEESRARVLGLAGRGGRAPAAGHRRRR